MRWAPESEIGKVCSWKESEKVLLLSAPWKALRKVWKSKELETVPGKATLTGPCSDSLKAFGKALEKAHETVFGKARAWATS